MVSARWVASPRASAAAAAVANGGHNACKAMSTDDIRPHRSKFKALAAKCDAMGVKFLISVGVA